jgi:hypothetical protein
MSATLAYSTTDGRNQPMSGGADNAALFEQAPPLAVQQWLGLAKPHALNIGRRALLLALVAWAPLILFAIAQSLWLRADHVTPLLTQAGVHARYLVAVPLLVLAEAWCVPQINTITRHFAESGIVHANDQSRFSDALSTTRTLLQSRSAEVVAFAFAYLIVLATILSYQREDLPAWAVSAGITPFFSPAGWWHMLVSLPLLLVLIVGWLWRLAVWTRLLWLVSRLDLQLVASHPDHCAGLGFLGQSLRAFAPVAMAFAAIAAGRSAYMVLSGSGLPTPQLAFNIGLMLGLMALFAAPLLAFMPTLTHVWRRGALSYGALADEAGHAFEHKWLGTPHVDRGTLLEKPDFSAINDLYAVVANVHAIRFVPVGIKDLIMLAAATLLPFVPVVLLAFPLDEIWRSVGRLLL